MKDKGQILVEAQERESKEIDVMTITTVQDVDEMQERESEEIDWMTVTEKVEQDMEETQLRGECIEQTDVDNMRAAEDLLEDMSKDMDKNHLNEEIDEFIKQDLSERVLEDMQKTRCDELDKQVQDNVVGVLMHQLEVKEIEVGELQIENNKLLQANMELMKKTVNSKDNKQLIIPSVLQKQVLDQIYTD